MRLELAYPTATLPGNPIPYNLSRTTPIWFPVNGDDISGLDDLTLESSKQEGNQVKSTMSGDLLFYDNVGGTKTLILNAFYNSISPINYMWVRIYDCECGEWIFKGQITRDKIEWCSGDCFVKCRASQYDEITDAYNSLNNVLNYDAYLDDPSEHVLNFLITDGDTGVGVENYQEAVRVGGLLRNSIASLPEFVFKSSILDSSTGPNGWTGDKYGITTILGEAGDTNVYYHSYLLNADISKGIKERKTDDVIRFEHRYIRTIKQFFEELKTVYNADYLVKKVGSQIHFIFERKDYFFQASEVWKDCTNYNVCFEIDNRNQYAYADLKWNTQSNLNDTASINLDYAMYNNIEEWNNPVSPIQKDAYSVYTQYGYAPVGNPGGVGFIMLRKPYTFSTPTLVIPGDFVGTAPLGPYYNLGTYSYPHYTARLYDMNSPFYFNGNLASVYYEYSGLGYYGTELSPALNYSRYRDVNLYDCFHFIENPRDAPNNVGYKSKYSKKYLRFNVEVEFSCAEYLAFTSDSAVMIDVFGTPSKAVIENVEWDFKKRTCKIRGII